MLLSISCRYVPHIGNCFCWIIYYNCYLTLVDYPRFFFLWIINTLFCGIYFLRHAKLSVCTSQLYWKKSESSQQGQLRFVLHQIILVILKNLQFKKCFFFFFKYIILVFSFSSPRAACPSPTAKCGSDRSCRRSDIKSRQIKKCTKLSSCLALSDMKSFGNNIPFDQRNVWHQRKWLNCVLEEEDLY